MIAFGPHVRVRFYDRRISEVLELASSWALLASVDVVIHAIDNRPRGGPTLHGLSLAIDLAPVSDRADHRRDLALFLEPRLTAPWAISLGAPHVRVAWGDGAGQT